jgi:hypothetical protein
MVSIPEQKAAVETFSGEPLTEEENRAVRRMLKTEDRMRWFWSTARVWFMWFAAVATFVVTVWKPVTDTLRGWLK